MVIKVEKLYKRKTYNFEQGFVLSSPTYVKRDMNETMSHPSATLRFQARWMRFRTLIAKDEFMSPLI